MSSKSSKASILHPEPHARTQALNDQFASFSFNRGRQTAAEKETQNPIKDLITGVKNGISKIFGGAVETVTDFGTSAVATVSNAGRWAWDTITKPVTRAAIAISDLGGEKTFGKISGMMRSIRERIHKAFSPSEHEHEAHEVKGAHGGNGGAHKPVHH